MLTNNTKSTNSASGRPALLRSVRSAIAGRGLRAVRGLPTEPRSTAPSAERAASAERIGAAVTAALSLALLVGGSLMVAQIWANLGMIR
ncbi:MAG TPA: hypothetical protein VGI29_11610 [Candidatus Binataceae bacterium]|jgi:hypothetical protein